MASRRHLGTNKLFFLREGGLEREALLLEGAETSGEGQMRRTAHIPLLPPEQQHTNAHIAESEEP